MQGPFFEQKEIRRGAFDELLGRIEQQSIVEAVFGAPDRSQDIDRRLSRFEVRQQSRIDGQVAVEVDRKPCGRSRIAGVFERFALGHPRNLGTLGLVFARAFAVHLKPQPSGLVEPVMGVYYFQKPLVEPFRAHILGNMHSKHPHSRHEAEVVILEPKNLARLKAQGLEDGIPVSKGSV